MGGERRERVVRLGLEESRVMKNDYSPAPEMGQDRPCKCAPDTLQVSYNRNRHAIQAEAVLRISRANTNTRRFSIENQMCL